MILVAKVEYFKVLILIFDPHKTTNKVTMDHLVEFSVVLIISKEVRDL